MNTKRRQGGKTQSEHRPYEIFAHLNEIQMH